MHRAALRDLPRVVFWFLPLGMAFAFLGVQLAVFGVYMGASFAPNHKGMPIIAQDAKVDFLSKQVLTSRNIRGGWWVDPMGGLNYQVEHHLFPNMPRPNLARAREIVREYCETLDIPYTETTLPFVRHRDRVPQPRRPLGPRPLRLPPCGSVQARLASPTERLRASAWCEMGPEYWPRYNESKE